MSCSLFQVAGVASKPDKPEFVTLPTLREQTAIQDAWTEQRISNIPNILDKYAVDAWLTTQREYAEDTVFWSLKSAKQFSARRRTLQLFLANPKPGTPFSYTWGAFKLSYFTIIGEPPSRIGNTPLVYQELFSILSTQNLSKIAVNTSPNISFSSGLHVGELSALSAHLGEKWTSRFVSVPMVAVEFVASKVPEQLEWYRKLQSTAWAMIQEGFSEKVITPGETTTEVITLLSESPGSIFSICFYDPFGNTDERNQDIEWHLHSKLLALNYTTWFHSDVMILTNLPLPSSPSFLPSPSPYTAPHQPDPNPRNIIQHGDLLHVDFGLTALGLTPPPNTSPTSSPLPNLHPSIPKTRPTKKQKVKQTQDIVRS
ncbi:hypothetical protein NA56DRAFT_703571 [Hyaloscypha hepaticicola]|uniref:Uncharacterized protein n=1 Tax=Hyaloscypha hepaticicola TaxID=2082293 RepID=A0A2J6Q532_9HELO|nr:hypothetical protein NA56DRAFT_703571 [Hyaloscypha hepaticicola]